MSNFEEWEFGGEDENGGNDETPEGFAGFVEAEDEVFESADRILARNWEKVLNIEVDGVQLREKIAPALQFFAERALAHNEAEDKMRGMFSQFGEGFALDPQRAIAKIPRVNFYSGRSTDGVSIAGLSAKERFLPLIKDGIRKYWARYGYKHIADSYFPDGSTGLSLALDCPRMLGDKEDLGMLGLGGVDQNSAVEAVRFQVMAAKLTRNCIENMQRPPSLHREAYFMAQVATLIGRNVGQKIQLDKAPAALDAPSLGLDFGEGGEEEIKAKVRDFIDARISILLPDKNKNTLDFTKCDRIVQEDFVSYDLQALADKYGLAEEYAPIFEAMFYYRQLQFYRDFHLDPQAKPSLVDILQYHQRHGQAVNVASLGCGNRLLEKIILELGLADNVFGIDQNPNSEKRENYKNKGVFVSLHNPNSHERSDGGVENIELRERAFAELRQVSAADHFRPKVVMAMDSLHETDNHKAYFLSLWQNLNPGDTLIISDPTYCAAVDGVTGDTVMPFDSTRHLGSMPSLERYLRLLDYIRLKGAEILSVKRVPGVYGGYLDALFRLHIVLRKPISRAALPYELPAEISSKIPKNSDQIFEVWPLNLIPGDKRPMLCTMFEDFNAVSASDAFSLEEFYNYIARSLIDKSSVRTQTRKALLADEHEMDFDQDFRPFNYLEGETGALTYLQIDDPELTKRNDLAGRIIKIAAVLKQKFDVDITGRMQLPGWEHLRV